MGDPQELVSRRLAGHVLATHPEAQSLLFEAGHRRALARQSAAEVSRMFAAMQAARLAYESLCHRLDPRRTRTVSFGLALTLQTAIFAVLLALSAVEFTGVLSGWMRVADVAAAATWTGLAWLAALAVREKRQGLLAAVAAGAITLGLLVTALHAASPLDRHANLRYGLGTGLLATLLILTLVAVAATLSLRTEPASLMLLRHRWHRCRAEYSAVVRTHRADAEADIIAGQGWHSFLETQARSSAGGQERVIPGWPAKGNSQPGPQARPSR
jgi:hypothetical protein